MTIGRIQSATPAGRAKLSVAFDDGFQATIELAAIIRKHPNLASLAEENAFQDLRVSDDGWSVEWPGCGIDFGAPQLRRWADEQSGRTMSTDAFREWMQRN